jgi:hypothetical protein
MSEHPELTANDNISNHHAVNAVDSMLRWVG